MQVISLTKRNMKLFFHDKGLFLTALITPLILLTLFALFLGNTYEQMVETILGANGITTSLERSFVGAYQLSSLLGTSCITVAFCTNLLMVQDKVTGARRDFLMAPLSRARLSISYFIASEGSILLILMIATLVGIFYIGSLGYYLTSLHVLETFGVVCLLSTFGTVLSGILSCFLSTQGQMTAVSTVVSAVYGFLCGAYIPLSQISEKIRSVISILPGTFGVNLLRQCLIGDMLVQIEEQAGSERAKTLADAFDIYLYFDYRQIQPQAMLVVLTLCTLVFLIVQMMLIGFQKRRKE